MMMSKTYYVSIALFLMGIGCIAPSTFATKKEPARISYSKGPCFGFCPQFHMEIFQNGHMVYEGTKNTVLLGTYSSQLPKRDYKKVVQWFEQYRFDTLPESVNLDIMDAPTTTLRFDQKTIKSKGSPPPALQAISDSLNQLLLSSSWSLIAPVWDDHVIPNEIIVQLHQGISIQTWLKEFVHYGLYLKQTVSPTKNMHVVSFQAAQHDPKKIFMDIHEHKKVIKVEFNKTLDLR